MSILPSTLPSSTHTPLRGGATLRWGILAPGRIAHDWATTVHANTDQRVVAVASRSAERAAAFAANACPGFQLPANVHFAAAGWQALADATVDAVLKALA